MMIDRDFYDFATHAIARHGDRALAYAKEQQNLCRLEGLRDDAFWGRLIAALIDLQRSPQRTMEGNDAPTRRPRTSDDGSAAIAAF